MGRELHLEFTDNTLVQTDRGVERLIDILHRPVRPALWAIKWKFNDIPNGISFHKSHSHARDFARLQIDSVPDGPARLVDVSASILDCVEKNDYCWTNLQDFSQALTYEGETWKH